MAFFEGICYGITADFLPLSAAGIAHGQPEKHPPKFSMIPLLVTLTAVTRVARRFVSTGGRHHSSQMINLSVAEGETERFIHYFPSILCSFGRHTS